MSETQRVDRTESLPFHGYQVQKHDHGYAITGPVPVSHLGALMKALDDDGYKLIDAVISERLGATMAIVADEEASEAWRKQLDIRPDHPNWLLSGDTGLSSKTIYAFFTGEWHVLRRGMDDASVPHDDADFGRCHRLLARYPEWRHRLHEVAERFAEWQPLVERWGELSYLHTKGDRTAVNNLIDELLKKGRDDDEG